MRLRRVQSVRPKIPGRSRGPIGARVEEWTWLSSCRCPGSKRSACCGPPWDSWLCTVVPRTEVRTRLPAGRPSVPVPPITPSSSRTNCACTSHLGGTIRITQSGSDHFCATSRSPYRSTGLAVTGFVGRPIQPRVWSSNHTGRQFSAVRAVPFEGSSWAGEMPTSWTPQGDSSTTASRATTWPTNGSVLAST